MLGHRPNAEETDRALRALSNACRRRLLFELYAEVESGEGESFDYTGITPFWTGQRRILLYHAHLPKLEACGYVVWDRAENTIRKGPRWDEIEPILELVSSNLYELPPSLQGTPSGRSGEKP